MRKKADGGYDIAHEVGRMAAADAYANGTYKEDAIYEAIDYVCGYEQFADIVSTFGSFYEVFTYWLRNTEGGREFIDTVYAEFDDEYEWYG